MVNVIVASIERKGRISEEMAQNEFRRILISPWDIHKEAVKAKLIRNHHENYIPPEERTE